MKVFGCFGNVFLGIIFVKIVLLLIIGVGVGDICGINCKDSFFIIDLGN